MIGEPEGEPEPTPERDHREMLKSEYRDCFAFTGRKMQRQSLV